MTSILSITSSVGPLQEIVTHEVHISSHALADNDCETRGVSYTATVQEIAPGLVTLPDFRCGNCGYLLKTELVVE